MILPDLGGGDWLAGRMLDAPSCGILLSLPEDMIAVFGSAGAFGSFGLINGGSGGKSSTVKTASLESEAPVESVTFRIITCAPNGRLHSIIRPLPKKMFLSGSQISTTSYHAKSFMSSFVPGAESASLEQLASSVTLASHWPPVASITLPPSEIHATGGVFANASWLNDEMVNTANKTSTAAQSRLDSIGFIVFLLVQQQKLFTTKLTKIHEVFYLFFLRGSSFLRGETFLCQIMVYFFLLNPALRNKPQILRHPSWKPFLEK
jgi:hypothetical protein